MEYSFDRVKSAVIAQRLNFQSLKTISISFQAQDLYCKKFLKLMLGTFPSFDV